MTVNFMLNGKQIAKVSTNTLPMAEDHLKVYDYQKQFTLYVVKQLTWVKSPQGAVYVEALVEPQLST